MNLEEDIFSFNFWPSFADLMLSVVLILIIVIFVIYSVLSAGSVNLRHVEERQHTMIDELATSYGTTAKELATKANGKTAKDSKTKFYAIYIDRDTIPDVVVRNEPTLQRFSFGSHILFAKNGTELTDSGQQVLRSLGASLKKQLPLIREIQIQGHADPDTTRSYRSNLDLAALRAIEVYRFFQNAIGIDPAQHLMSATSFGEFKPVQRSDDDTYSFKKLNAHNFTEAQKSQNRRIELLLFYRF
jgi:flagellar motor protein MotB